MLDRTVLKRLLFRFSKRDRRCRFHDISKQSPNERRQRSPIIQFYSSVDNIGNYLPVLGIQRMLAQETDVWCMHRRPYDFDYINSRYRYCIIGGAGLLHKCFEPFWEAFAEHCRLPVIIWGVGACFVDSLGDESAVDRATARAVFDRAERVNVRDDTTADLYGLREVSITPCPTIEYLGPIREAKDKCEHSKRPKDVLFASHEELVSADETKRICHALKDIVGEFVYSNNVQTPATGLTDILRLYDNSEYVVTTRLHGAIIAHGLGVPYYAIARDEKLRAFNRLYGGGIVADTIDEISDKALASVCQLDVSPDVESVRRFGKIATNCIVECLNS